MKDAILVEHEWQVKDLLENGVPRSGAWVALGPYAMYELEKQGIHYSIPEEFYTETEFVQLREHAQQTVTELCKIGDRISEEIYPQIKTLQIKLFHYYVIDLTILIDGILWRIFQLEKIVSALKPAHIYSHRNPQDLKLSSRLFFGYLDNLYARVLEAFDFQVNLRWFHTPDAQSRTADNHYHMNFKQQLASYLMHSYAAWNVYTLIKENSFRGLADFLNLTRKPELIIYSGEYNWRYCKNRLAEDGFTIRSIYESMLLPKYSSLNHRETADREKIIAAFENNNEFRRLFIYQHKDWYPLLRGRIHHLLFSGSKVCMHAYRKIKYLCDCGKVKAFLVAICDNPAAFAATQAARHANIPVITHQHGCEGYYRHFLVPYMDLMHSDYFLTYGEGVNKTYRTYAQDFGTQLIAVGSVKADSLRKKTGKELPRGLYLKIEKLKTKNRKIILYATTLYMHNFTAFRFTQGGVYSDRLLYLGQKEIINGLLRLNGASTIFKLIPVPYVHKPDPPMLHEPGFVPEWAMVVKNEVGFLDLLPFADAVVLDEASTTLIEAVVLKVPIFLLVTDPKIFVNNALELIRRRVVFSQDPKELVARVNEYLISREYVADINDRAFAREYSVFQDDGNSLERVVQVFRKVVTKKTC